MPLIEQYCRIVCEWRGVPPDEPLTIGYPDGSEAKFDVAWQAYVPLCEQLLALHD